MQSSVNSVQPRGGINEKETNKDYEALCEKIRCESQRNAAFSVVDGEEEIEPSLWKTENNPFEMSRIQAEFDHCLDSTEFELNTSLDFSVSGEVYSVIDDQFRSNNFHLVDKNEARSCTVFNHEEDNPMLGKYIDVNFDPEPMIVRASRPQTHIQRLDLCLSAHIVEFGYFKVKCRFEESKSTHQPTRRNGAWHREIDMIRFKCFQLRLLGKSKVVFGEDSSLTPTKCPGKKTHFTCVNFQVRIPIIIWTQDCKVDVQMFHLSASEQFHQLCEREGTETLPITLKRTSKLRFKANDYKDQRLFE